MRTGPSRALAVAAALLAVNAVLFLAQPGLALPNSFLGFLFGPNMIRAEAIVKVNGVVHDYRVDRGRIRLVGGGAMTLYERDGTVATIRIAPDARIQVNGRSAGLAALRRGMRATAVRDGDAPAEIVQAFSPP